METIDQRAATNSCTKPTLWEYVVHDKPSDDVVELHKFVMKAFPQSQSDEARSNFGVLWATLPGSSSLVVRSKERPNVQAWNNIDGNMDKPEAVDGGQVSFPDGSVHEYLFTAAINPTKRKLLRNKPDRRSKARGKLIVVDPIEWLIAQGTSRGFSVHPTEVVELSSVTYPLPGKDDKAKLRISTLSGVFRVTDIDKLRHAWADGIGRGKAYGTGMLVLEPASVAAQAG